MNLGTLTTTTQQLINDAQGTRQSGLYTAALNLAQQQFVIDTKCLWKDQTTAAITPGTAAYALPTDFLWEKLVMYNGVPLQPASRAALARTHQGSRWDTITGTPTNYCIDPDVSKSDILLFPIPAANDIYDLVLTYYAYPLDMSSSTDIPLNATPLLTQFHLAIAAWAGWYLLATEDADPKVQANRKQLLDIYNDLVSQCTDTFKNTVSEPIRMRGVRYCPTSK